jgi:LacI family transcriptional regulator, galactose operon repressor
VTDEVRDEVMRAVRELGYERNHAARSLRRRSTEVVAIVERPVSNPWSARLNNQLHATATARGYSVITVLVGADDSADTAMRILREQHVDGAILTARHGVSLTELGRLAENGLALIVFDDVAKPNGFDVVRRAQEAACYQAVMHLLERGHRRIAFYGHATYLLRAEKDARYAGYAGALKDCGVPVDKKLLFPVADSRRAAFQATETLLRERDRPTAIFAASDRAALAAIWAAQQQRVAVPGDLAVVGVGNTDEGEVVRPTLTTVGAAHFDFTEVVQRLFERISAGAPERGKVLNQTWGLVVRESS